MLQAQLFEDLLQRSHRIEWGFCGQLAERLAAQPA